MDCDYSSGKGKLTVSRKVAPKKGASFDDGDVSPGGTITITSVAVGTWNAGMPVSGDVEEQVRTRFQGHFCRSFSSLSALNFAKAAFSRSFPVTFGHFRG
jgi:hypothetical protein